jgi:poly(ADP-ribose) glycohydrolase ARH3
MTGIIYIDRCRGAVLGAMAGDALGAPVEGKFAGAIANRFRAGELAQMDCGRYTDDFQMTLALMTSLLRRGRCDALDAAAAYASAFDSRRGYAPGASRVLQALVGGADPRSTGTMTAPDGSYGNGGAMRIAPLGLAYRHAPLDVLRGAVRAALLPTHIHPLAIDGAAMQAAAVGWLSRQEGAARGRCTPAALLVHLQGVVETEEARGKLALLAQAVEQQVGACW